MNTIRSKYRFFGGFGLLIGLNLLIGFGVFKLVTDSKISYDKVDLINDSNAIYAYIIMAVVTFFFLSLIMTQAKFVLIDKDAITFINPLLPFFKRKYKWSDFDYYILVDEDSRYDSYEAVWLIKEKKLKCRFSSFYYTNYKDLKRQIKTEGYGKKNYGMFEQLFLMLRLMKVKN